MALSKSTAKQDVAVHAKSRITLYQRVIFSLLRGIDDGYITVQDTEGKTYRFGKPSDQTLQVNITVHDLKAYRHALFHGDVGAADGYVLGYWSADNLVSLIRIFCRNIDRLNAFEKRFNWITNAVRGLMHFGRRNNKAGSQGNIAAHYDLSNDMYALFLDKEHMQYSSAIFVDGSMTLEQAQEEKLHRLCQQLALTSDDNLLEIGTGWGGLACFAAKHYGCRVTTTTISKAQHQLAAKRIQQQGLEKQVTLLLHDYRDLTGTFSKIVSVEMIEAVGRRYLPAYFRKINALLKPQGRFVMQAITISDQRYDHYCKSVDFIQRYIFPGGHLPSLSAISQCLKNQTHMQIKSLQDYSDDYAVTLSHWRERFCNNKPSIQALGFDDAFFRLWNYYFAYCQGGFAESTIQLLHIDMLKTGSPTA